MRDMIAYMNARKAAKAATGGAKQDYSAEYAPDSELDQFEQALGKANTAISDFALWAEATRYDLIKRLGIPQTETKTEIPF